VVVTKGVILLLYFDVGNAVSSSFNGMKKKTAVPSFEGFAVSAGLMRVLKRVREYLLSRNELQAEARSVRMHEEQFSPFRPGLY
jgi:hypothetical protein